MDQNKVALCLRQPVPKSVKVNGKSYFFNPQHGVSLCWVEEEDVPALMLLKGGCCGRKAPLCHRATEGEIRVFETGKR